ncbi:MAG: hypothetical protein M4D80_25075 [Myxococcota bacterium]|nr:hypothetical protein [Myxococcota bacterium]
MRKILLLVAVLGLSACGKKGDEAKGDCGASVANAVNLSAEEFKKQGVTDATVAKIRESSVVRCKEDKWTNEVLKCLADAKKADDVAKCQQMMSKEQSDNMAKAIAGAMGTQPDQGSGSAPDQGSGGSAGSGSAAPTAESPAGLPAECTEYKTLVDKLSSCEKLPQASRDMLKKTFDDTSKAWVNIDKLPADARAALAGGCKQGADALKQSAGASCGF